MIQASFTYRQSNKKYEFGGGEKTHSLGTVRLPIYFLDQDKKPHILPVWVVVFNQKNLPLLLGGKSLTRAGGTLCFKTLTLSLDWRNKRLCLPVKQSDSTSSSSRCPSRRTNCSTERWRTEPTGPTAS